MQQCYSGDDLKFSKKRIKFFYAYVGIFLATHVDRSETGNEIEFIIGTGMLLTVEAYKESEKQYSFCI